jgi:hypothetical protein
VSRMFSSGDWSPKGDAALHDMAGYKVRQPVFFRSQFFSGQVVPESMAAGQTKGGGLCRAITWHQVTASGTIRVSDVKSGSQFSEGRSA